MALVGAPTGYFLASLEKGCAKTLDGLFGQRDENKGLP